MIAVYVGNYEYDASERELERTFEKYGPVDRVEFKSGAR
jgi:arginine/serine-rich splicing factor 4/5/6